MDRKQQDTFIKALACLAWADGSVSDEEKEKLIGLMTTMGAAIDKKTIMGRIDSNRQVTTGLVQEVKALPYEVVTVHPSGNNEGQGWPVR